MTRKNKQSNHTEESIVAQVATKNGIELSDDAKAWLADSGLSMTVIPDAAAQTADTPEQKNPAEAVAEFFDKATPAFEKMKRLMAEADVIADAIKNARERLEAKASANDIPADTPNISHIADTCLSLQRIVEQGPSHCYFLLKDLADASASDIPAEVVEQWKAYSNDASDMFDEIGSELDTLVKAAVELMDDDTKTALLGQAHALHVKFAELQEHHKFFEGLHLRQRGVIADLKGDLDTSLAARKKLAVELEDTKERQQCAEKELAFTQRDLTAAYEDMKILRNEKLSDHIELDALKEQLKCLSKATASIAPLENIRHDPRYRQAFEEDARRLATGYGLSADMVTSMLRKAQASSANGAKISEPLDLSPEACTRRCHEEIIRKYPDTEIAKWLKEQLDAGIVVMD